jgi:hypothetical protein
MLISSSAGSAWKVIPDAWWLEVGARLAGGWTK